MVEEEKLVNKENKQKKDECSEKSQNNVRECMCELINNCMNVLFFDVCENVFCR